MTYPAGRSGKSWPDVTSPPRCRRALAWLGSAMEQVFLGDLFTGIIGFGRVRCVRYSLAVTGVAWIPLGQETLGESSTMF